MEGNIDVLLLQSLFPWKTVAASNNIILEGIELGHRAISSKGKSSRKESSMEMDFLVYFCGTVCSFAFSYLGAMIDVSRNIRSNINATAFLQNKYSSIRLLCLTLRKSSWIKLPNWRSEREKS
jgi:hypothetical protein